MAGFSNIPNIFQGAFSSKDAPTDVYGMKNKIPSGYRNYATQQFTPEQIELFSQLFSHLGPESYTSRLAQGDQSMFADIEKPALQQFNELQGNLASRFSGMGMGARNSSGFQNASNAAAQDFASQLQSNRQGLQRQALMDLMGMSESLMNQRPFEQGLAQKSQKPGSFLQNFGANFANSIASGAGKAVGGMFF